VGASPGTPVELFIRPHRIRPLTDDEPADNTLQAQVTRRTYTGDVVTLECETPAGRVTCETPGGTNHAQPGDSLRLGFRARDVMVFPA
jgi:putative spermidine/putrescine transport system ATP-binding protein